jgi:hypothetical protein
MPWRKRRSSWSVSSRWMPGKALLPSPTMIGAMNRLQTSIRPALNAWAARVGPLTVRSRVAEAFIR